MPPTRKTKTHKAKASAEEPTPTFSELTQTCQDTMSKYEKAPSTLATYRGHIKRGCTFLQGIVTKMEVNPGDLEGTPVTSLTELAAAFDNPPNCYSVLVLKNFITKRVVIDKCSISTADGIQSAFAWHWDKMDETKYGGGVYRCDKETGVVTGNPGRSKLLLDYLKALRAMANVEGKSAKREHAEAMTIEEMQQIMEWSELVCPHERLERPNFRHDDIDDFRLVAKHGMMRAWFSSGFTLWTRNVEMCALKRRNLSFGHKGPAPHFFPYFKVTLETRKGSQGKAAEGKYHPQTYHIYEQPEKEIDMYTHLLRWIGFLQIMLGRELNDDDYIFPHISPNGTIQPTQETTYDTVSNLFTEFCEGADLKKIHTTHSLRRGGPQHRFIHAPPSQRWSLHKSQWWGGWADHENVDMVSKYLLNSVHKLEREYSDALYPGASVNLNQSFMGGHDLVQPVTKGEYQQSMMCLGRQIHELTHEVRIQNYHGAGVYPGASYATANPVTSSAMAFPHPSVVQNMNVYQFTPHGTSGWPPPPVYHPTFTPQPYHPPYQRHPSEQGTPSPTTSHFPRASQAPDRSHTQDSNDLQREAQPLRIATETGHLLPQLDGVIPDVFIEDIHGPPEEAWQTAIQQWEKPHPKTGQLALRDWPDKWFKGRMRDTISNKRLSRRRVAEAFYECGSDRTAFLNAYPEARHGLAALNKAIQQRMNVRRRVSKNGNPTQRAASATSSTSA
ncbi:hypothetical protein BDN72DRAFT_896416 [Pluteus cervinus]|uniref:Uncharacterized protein n=1 Tax=Pluteus cervinus TaxID=181527 RepID=A0ACD3AYV3_9AGAR|nr:hypothetical protein BDN72DRAFT_896416 [Pluteus cervinus]